MQAVLSSSDAQTGDHAKLLLEEWVPTLSCCKQRFENPGGGWQTCSSTFFYLLLLLLFHINSSSAVKLKNIPGPPPPSSGCLHLHLFIAEKTGRKKVFPQEELCEGGRFHSGGREDKLLMNTPPPLPPDWNPTKPPSQGTAGGKKKSPVTWVLVPERPTAWL